MELHSDFRHEMNVSRIAQGTWAIGGLDVGRHGRKRIDSNDSRRPRQGITLIDTAPVYGLVFPKKSLERQLRRKGIGIRFSSRQKLDSSGTTCSVSRNSSARSHPEGGPRFAPSTSHGLHRHLSSPLAGFSRPDRRNRPDHASPL